MKYFIKKSLFFFFPLALVLFPPLGPLFASGEYFQNLDEEVIKQDEPFLIGYVYNEHNYRYLKWKSLKVREPFSVVALGSSRVLQFREGMFTCSFYNAGYTIKSIYDFLPFLESLPEEKYPEYLIIGLDQWMFNGEYDRVSIRKKREYWSSSFTKIPGGADITLAWEDIFNDKYDLMLQDASDTITLIGLNAYVNQKGMRNDGSMYYGSQIQHLINNDSAANDFQFKQTLQRIAKNEGRFQTTTAISIEALEELDRLLKFCRLKNIYVVGFLPPFAQVVSEQFEVLEGYGFMQDIYPKASTLFQSYDYELYDFSKISDFEGLDKEMIDGFHGSEVIYLRMLIRILNSKSELNKVAKIQALQTDLRLRRNDYLVY